MPVPLGSIILRRGLSSISPSVSPSHSLSPSSSESNSSSPSFSVSPSSSTSRSASPSSSASRSISRSPSASISASPSPSTGGGGFVLRTASNTGLLGAGISEAGLATQGAITYSTNGQTISGKKFTGEVQITGSNITIDSCLFNLANGTVTNPITVNGSNFTVSNSTIRPASGHNFCGILVESGSITVSLCDITLCENLMSIYGGSVHLINSYLHDSASSDPTGHVDGIEVYGGSNHIFELSTILCTRDVHNVSPFNIAPWSGNTSVSDCTIQDNYIDCGHTIILVDLQSTGTIHNTRVVRNRMGGHTDAAVFGHYATLLNAENRTLVQTEAALQASPNSILWPSTGPDVNVWFYCTSNPFGLPNLSPDNTGLTA